jgi:hypothetical protein
VWRVRTGRRRPGASRFDLRCPPTLPLGQLRQVQASRFDLPSPPHFRQGNLDRFRPLAGLSDGDDDLFVSYGGLGPGAAFPTYDQLAAPAKPPSYEDSLLYEAAAPSPAGAAGPGSSGRSVGLGPLSAEEEGRERGAAVVNTSVYDPLSSIMIDDPGPLLRPEAHHPGPPPAVAAAVPAPPAAIPSTAAAGGPAWQPAPSAAAARPAEAAAPAPPAAAVHAHRPNPLALPSGSGPHAAEVGGAQATSAVREEGGQPAARARPRPAAPRDGPASHARPSLQPASSSPSARVVPRRSCCPRTASPRPWTARRAWAGRGPRPLRRCGLGVAALRRPSCC